MSNAHVLLYAGFGLLVGILYGIWQYQLAKRHDRRAMEEMRRHVRREVAP